MALKKSELYSSLWSSCDALRGGMDASQYKDYVLVLLFIKYVSDKYAGIPYAPITIPKGAAFQDMVALKGKSDIGDQINKKIIAPLAKANDLADMPDFNDATKLGAGKEMVDKLTDLIAIFQNPALDFSKNRAEGDDILGDAYEYLMRHFATESGKSKGQFYTPAEVSRVIAQVVGIGRAAATGATVYDPTCGSGSLLLKLADAARGKVTLYGQEKDAATAGLARMNMILHNNPTALIRQGNTLANPLFKEGDTLKTFDYVVANPPFSDKRWISGVDPLNDPYNRFKPFGAPPAKQGDYAYLLHIVRSLRSTGKGACILPHGVLFRGNAEAEIRRALIRKGYLTGIVGLPPNLFYGTGIPACIVVLDKQDAHTRKGIFLIDASAGFLKDGNKNRLRAMDIHKIVDTFNRRVEIPGYSRKEHEPQRVALYKAVANLVRSYANIADELDRAGYTLPEIARLKHSLDRYVKLREIIRRASDENLDLKAYEADMRHLLDTYIEASAPRVISPFDKMSLVDLIVNTGIAEAINRLPEGIKSDRNAIAETIENNVRHKIVRNHLNDPAYYDTMSALLNELISARKAKAIEYEAYLKQIAALAKRVEAGHAGDAPAEIDTPARRALYNNLNQDRDLALKLDTAIRENRPDSWRGIQAREMVVKRALYDVLRRHRANRAHFPDRQTAAGILMVAKLDLGGIPVEVVRKDIKNVHLSVYPPTGAVRISAPLRMNLDTIRVFAISKLAWIRQQQKQIAAQERETPREFLERESHYVWGRRYLLKLIENDAPPQTELKHRQLVLQIRPGTSQEKRQALLEDWYRTQLKTALPPLIAQWEPLMHVKVRRFFVRRMKTRWGSCNPKSGAIRLNTDLARKPRECLEYIVVHEMAHLLEPTHNSRFTSLMDLFIPAWRSQREALNRLPVRHEHWEY